MTAAQPALLSRNPGRTHGIRLATGLAGFILSLAAVQLSGAARPSADDLVARARAALPTGWALHPAAIPALPHGWNSTDMSGLSLQIDAGGASHTVTLVPLDWVGVQLKGPQIETVRQGATAKVIVPTGSLPAISAWLDTFAPESASLATPQGTTHAYAGQYDRVDAEVRHLLRKGGASREVATASFIALGVPAEEPIRDAALQARHPARLAAVYSLRHFPGRATREALHRIIADKARDAAADTRRLAAVETCQALMLDTHGPALAIALQVEKDETVVARLAAEVNRMRFSEAAPELRHWLRAATSLETQVACARALATVRDQSAAEAIHSALSAPPPRRASVVPSGDAAARGQLALHLHRLTGRWGEASRGVRLSLAVESPDRALVYVENMGPAAFHYLLDTRQGAQPWPAGLDVALNGATVSPWGITDADLSQVAGSAQEIPSGSVVCFELHLTQPLPVQGDHLLEARWLDLSAAPLTLRSGVVSEPQAEPAS